MKIRIILFVITSITLMLSALPVNADVLYKNAQLVQPERHQVTPDSYLWVRDGRFQYVGTQHPQITPETQVVDLKGGYVTPGFIDTHAHIGLGVVSFTVTNDEVALHAENSQDIAQWNADKLLQSGVTSIRNPGGDTRANLAYRNAQRDGVVTGPRAFVAGAILNTAAFDGLAVAIDDETAIVNAVSYQAQQGVDYLKLYTGLSADQVKIAVREAREYNLPVIGHLESLSWHQGAALGINHLVHAMPISPDLLPDNAQKNYAAEARPGTFSFFEWYKAAELDHPKMNEMVGALQHHQTAVDPTLIVFYNAFFVNQAAVTEHERMADVHPTLIENWETFYHFNLGWSEQDFAQAQATWPKVLAFVKKLYDADVLLSVGTDLGNPWVIPGVSYYQELALLADAGIPLMDVLRLATVDGAEVLGQGHQLGKLEHGYLADFLVFEANPSEDLKHLDSLQWVVQNGNAVVQQ